MMIKQRIAVHFDLKNTITISDLLHYVNISISEKEIEKNQTLPLYLGLVIAKLETALMTVNNLIQQDEDKSGKEKK